MTRHRSAPPGHRLLRRATAADLDLTETAYSPGRTMGEHAHPETCVTLILRGSVEERVARREAEAETASMGIKPAQIEHSDRFGPAGSTTLKLRIGGGFVDRLEEFSRPLERWAWVPLGAAAPVMLRLRKRLWEDGPESAEVGWLEELAIELLAALQQDERLRDRPSAPGWLRAVRREVLGRYHEGVRTRALAERAGVHPVYLARAFRQSFGESMSECVRRLRVQEAARLLETGEADPSSVAYRTGFADQSHLTRVFRQETGLTPGRWSAT